MVGVDMSDTRNRLLEKILAASGGSTSWGSIIGLLSDQTDLQNALDGKADVAFAGDAPQRAVLDLSDLIVGWDPDTPEFLTVSFGDFINIIDSVLPQARYVLSAPVAQTQEDIDANPQTKFTTTPTLASGSWLILLAAEASSTSANRSANLELYADDVVVGSRFTYTPNKTSDKTWAVKVWRQSFASGAHTFRLDYGRSGGGGGASVTVENAFLGLLKV